MAWNLTKPNFNGTDLLQCILVDKQLINTPGKDAYIFGGECITRLMESDTFQNT